MQVCQHPPRSVAEEVAGSLAGRPQNRDPLVFTVYARYLPVSVPVRDGSARGPPGDGPGCRQIAAGTDPVRAHRQRPEWNRGWDDPFAWRRLRGSNPRGSCPPTRFPGVCLRPLGQASAAQSSQPRHAPATNRGEGGHRRRLPQERGDLLGRHPDPTEDARERTGGELSMERYGPRSHRRPAEVQDASGSGDRLWCGRLRSRRAPVR